jgi:tryptophan-rich sensory protein
MPALNHSPRPAGGWGKLIVLVVIVFAVAAAGQFLVTPKVPDWYAHLTKPVFAPPAWICGVAWVVCYAVTALAAWRVWTAPAPAPAMRAALAIFAVQLGLHALWATVFFGLQKPVSALILLIFHASAVAGTLRRFYLVDALAGLMLVPYLAWVLFATVLNAAIVGLNP